MNYILSLVVGLGVGLLYGLLQIRSPAPPIIALLGLLGMVAGEHAVSMVRDHLHPTQPPTVISVTPPSDHH